MVGGVGREGSKPSGAACEDDEIVMSAGVLDGVDDKSLGCDRGERLTWRQMHRGEGTFGDGVVIVATFGVTTDDSKKVLQCAGPRSQKCVARRDSNVEALRGIRMIALDAARLTKVIEN